MTLFFGFYQLKFERKAKNTVQYRVQYNTDIFCHGDSVSRKHVSVHICENILVC